MKMNMKNILALVLAFVMILGAVPMTAAVDGTVSISGKSEAWPGQQVALSVDYPDAESRMSVNWSGDVTPKNADDVVYTVAADATGTDTVSVTVKYMDNTELTDDHTITVLQPAGEDFAVSGPAEAEVGQSVTFTTTGENDSDVTYSVVGEGATITGAGRFKATEAGEYTVVATATNGGAIAKVTDEAAITVKDAAYTVTLQGGTFLLGSEGEKLDYTVKRTSDKTEVTPDTVSFSSSNAAVASVDNDGFLTPKKKGTATITVTVTVDGYTCSDEAEVKVSDTGAITCAQDMEEVGSDSLDMTFVFKGAGSGDVRWSVNVSGENDFSVSESSFTDDSTATVTVYADDGVGLAKVSVSAVAESGAEAEGTFYVSFYERNSFSVELAEGVKEFDFDENGVFAKIDRSTSGASRKSLYTLIADGNGTRVILSENSKNNKRVGEISKKTSSTFQQYDPDDYNDYSMTELERLTFEVKGEGEYELDFEVYGAAGGKGLATSKGTITIITGEGNADITYNCGNSDSVDLDAEDFVDFWEDFLKEEDEDEDEELRYVTFELSTSTSIEGSLLYDGKFIKTSWKFYEDPSSSQYDLNDVTYEASKNAKNYSDFISFNCVGEDGTETSGVLEIKVAGSKTSISFEDVSTTDWFYDEVAEACGAGIMNGVSDTKFDPNGTLTRAMVVTMIYRMERQPAISVSGTFSDVGRNEWFSEAVEWAASEKIVNGVGNDKFAPNDPITREQLATILYRYLTEYDGETARATASLKSFSDAQSVSDYAETAMKWATGAKIITGDGGKLMPQGKATRAQAAAMFVRFMDDPGVVETNDDDDDADEVVAYITPSGIKYHLDEDCAGKNAIEKKLSSVKNSYTPCSKCAR